MHAGPPGPHGGEALYELLTGQFTPTGRLPFTYPRNPHSLLSYDHKHSDSIGPDKETPGFNPLYEFGHGLSYTTFHYDNLEVPATPLDKNDKLRLSVDVTNTGKRRGTETVHVFIRDLFASVVPPVKRLRAFRQVDLSPGETKRVTFEIPVTDLSYFGLENSLILEPGEFEVMIGGLKKRIAVH